jgi:hypothetical protein
MSIKDTLDEMLNQVIRKGHITIDANRYYVSEVLLQKIGSMFYHMTGYRYEAILERHIESSTWDIKLQDKNHKKDYNLLTITNAHNIDTIGNTNYINTYGIRPIMKIVMRFGERHRSIKSALRESAYHGYNIYDTDRRLSGWMY